MFIPLNELGKYGVIADQAKQLIPPEAFNSVQNVRFREAAVERMLGESTVLGTPTIGPHFLLPWEFVGELYWLYMNGTYIYRTDGTTHTNVTRYTATPGDDNYTAGSTPLWNGGVLG